MTDHAAIPLTPAGLDIENESMRIIDDEAPRSRPYDESQWPVVRRMIHASADFELLELVRFHPLAVTAAVRALWRGCAVVTDTHMALAGLSARLYDPFGCARLCLINDSRTLERARIFGGTRAAAAVDVAAAEHHDAIWVIGNAPTALLRLLELADAGRVEPALVIGMPVGFVQAAESKQLLQEHERIASILVHGRKGGSALAAAALNALAGMALQSAGTSDQANS